MPDDMTKEAEGARAFNWELGRDGLSPAAQADYDRLAVESATQQAIRDRSYRAAGLCRKAADAAAARPG